MAGAAGAARLQSYALGYQAELAADGGQPEAALALARRALFLAESANAPEIAYLWLWRIGRLQAAAGEIDQAIRTLQQAVATVGAIRSDLIVLGARQGRPVFRQTVEPLHLELADLLLRRAAAGAGAAPRQDDLGCCARGGRGAARGRARGLLPGRVRGRAAGARAHDRPVGPAHRGALPDHPARAHGPAAEPARRARPGAAAGPGRAAHRAGAGLPAAAREAHDAPVPAGGAGALRPAAAAARGAARGGRHRHAGVPPRRAAAHDPARRAARRQRLRDRALRGRDRAEPGIARPAAGRGRRDQSLAERPDPGGAGLPRAALRRRGARRDRRDLWRHAAARRPFRHARGRGFARADALFGRPHRLARRVRGRPGEQLSPDLQRPARHGRPRAADQAQPLSRRAGRAADAQRLPHRGRRRPRGARARRHRGQGRRARRRSRPCGSSTTRRPRCWSASSTASSPRSRGRARPRPCGRRSSRSRPTRATAIRPTGRRS